METLKDLLLIGAEPEITSHKMTTALTDELEFYYVVQKDYAKVVELTIVYIERGHGQHELPINGKIYTIASLLDRASIRKQVPDDIDLDLILEE